MVQSLYRNKIFILVQIKQYLANQFFIEKYSDFICFLKIYQEIEKKYSQIIYIALRKMRSIISVFN